MQIIEGIGIDLVRIDRIKLVFDNYGERFLRRVFSDEEILNMNDIIISNKKRALQKIAGYFAAKEAFLKSAGCGLFSIPFDRIRIFNAPSGMPFFKFDENLKNLLVKKYKKTYSRIHLSITHENGLAIAFVVLER